REQVVLSEDLRYLTLAALLVAGDDALSAERTKRLAGLRQQKLRYGHNSYEFALRIGEIDGAETLDLAFEGSKVGERVGDRGLGRERHHVGRHATGSGVLFLLQQFSD